MFVDFEDMHAALTLKVMKVVRKTIRMSRVVGACWLMSVTFGVHANAQKSSGVSVDLQSSVPAPNRLVPASASASTLDLALSTSLAHISSSDAIQASSSEPDLDLGANSQSAPVLAPVTNLASDSAAQDLTSDQVEVAPNDPLALEPDSTKQALHQQRLAMAQVWFDAALASVKSGLSSDVSSDENSSSTLPSSSSLAVTSSSVTHSALGLGNCAHTLRPYNSLFKRMVVKSMKKDWGIGADATQKAWANDSAVKSIPSAATPVIDTVRSAFNQASTGKVGLHTAQALEQVTSPADANYVATDGVAANQTATNNNIAANSTAKTEIKLGYPQNLRQMQRDMTLSQALVQQQQWYKPRRCAFCQKLYDIRFLAYLAVPFQKASKITALAQIQTPQELCLFFVQTLMHQVKPKPAYKLSLSQALQINKSDFDSTRKVLENYKDILKEQIYLDLTSYRRNRDYVDNESLRFGVEVRPHDLPMGFARLHSPIALALQNAFNVAPMAQAADTVETIAAATLSAALESDKTLSNADATSGQDSTSSPESNLTSDADTVSSSGSTTGSDAVLPSDADSSPTKGSDASLTLVSTSVSTSGSASAPTSSSEVTATHAARATHADPVAVATDSTSVSSAADSQPKSAAGFGLAEHDVAVAVSVFVPSMAPEAQGKICDKFKALVPEINEATEDKVGGNHSFDQAFKHYKPRIRKDFKDEIEHVDNLNRAWNSLTNQTQNSANQSTAQQARIEVSPAKVNEINEAPKAHAPNEDEHKGSVTTQQSSSYVQSKLVAQTNAQTNAQAIESALAQEAEPNLTQAATLAQTQLQPQPKAQVKSQANVNHAAFAHEDEQNLEQAKANLKQLPQDQSHLDLKGRHDAMSQPINDLTVESKLRWENGLKTYSNHAIKYDEREAILSKTQMQEHIAQQRHMYIEQVKTGLAQNIVLIPLYQEYEMHDLLTEFDADLFSSIIFREPLQATQQGDAQATDKVRQEISRQYQDLGHDINAVLGQQAARETETVNHAKIKTPSHDGTVGARADAAADSKFEFKLQSGLAANLAANGASQQPSLVEGEPAVSLNARMSTNVDDKASRYLASAGENNQDNLSANGVEQLKSGFESKSGYSTFLENMFKSSWPYANGIEVLPGVAFNEGNAERLKSKVQSHRPIKPLDGKLSSAVGHAVGNAADANSSLDSASSSDSTDNAQNKALENVRNNVLVDTRPKLPRYLPRQAINMESLREYDSRIWPKTLFSFDSTGHIFTHSMMHNTKLIPNRHQKAMRSLKNKQWLHWLNHLSQPSSYKQPWEGRTKCRDPGVTGLGALYANVKPQQRQIDMDDSRLFWSSLYRLVWTEQVKDYDDAVFIQGVNDVPYSKQQQEDMRLSLNEWDKVFDSSFFFDENADLFFTEKQLTQMQSLYDLHQHRLTSQPAWFGEEFKFSSQPSLNLSSSASSPSSAHGLRSGFSSQLSSSVLADDKSLQPGSSSIATKCAMDLINIPGYEQDSYNTPGDAQASGYLDTPASSVVNFIRMCKPQASQ